MAVLTESETASRRQLVQETASGLEALAARELELLRYIVSNTIANEVYVSGTTLTICVAHELPKLFLSDRMQTVAFA